MMNAKVFSVLSVALAVCAGAAPAPLSLEDETRFGRIVELVPSSEVEKELSAEEILVRDERVKLYEGEPQLVAATASMEKKSLLKDQGMDERMQGFFQRTDSAQWVADSASDPAKEGELPLPGNTSESSGDLATYASEGGIYYNSEKGLFVAQKDVEIRNFAVKDSRFSLKCGNQLKIVMKAKEQEKKESAPAVEPGKEKPPFPEFKKMNFSEVEYASASGGVVLWSLNNKGEVQGAIGEKFAYDGATGDILIYGEGRKLLVGGNDRYETEAPGSYIRIYGNGSVFIQGDGVARMESQSDEWLAKKDKKGNKEAKPKRKKAAPTGNPEVFDLSQTIPDKELTVISSKGFSYFDVEKNLVVCQKDVNVRDPRFSLKCDNQFKAVLVRQTVPEKKEPAPVAAEGKEKIKVKFPQLEGVRFSGAEYASASGNVVMELYEEGGMVKGALAQEFTYDGKTGDILMSGEGKKVLRQGESYHVITGPKSYAKFMGNGDVRMVGTFRTLVDRKEMEKEGSAFSKKEKDKK